MILESGLVPPNTNFEELNPKIDLELLGIKVGSCFGDSFFFRFLY